MAAFTNNPISTVQMNIPIKSNGDIATTSEISAGVKKVNIDGIKTAATLAESATVFNEFYGLIGNTTFDSLSAKKTTVNGVTL